MKIQPGSIIKVYARHDEDCPHRADRFFKQCHCPLWFEYMYNGKQIKKSAKTRSWEKAAKMARQLEQTLLSGENPIQSVVLAKSVESAIKIFLDAKTERLAPQTMQKHKRLTSMLLEFCNKRGVLFIKDVNPELLLEWRHTWKYRPKSFSMRVHWLFVCTMFRWLHGMEIIARDPSARIDGIEVVRDPKRDGEGSPQTPPFTPAEMSAIIAAVDMVPGWDAQRRNLVRTLILLMRWSGLAVMDATCLERASLVDQTLTIKRFKTKSTVCMTLPPFVANALHQLQGTNPRYFFWDGVSARTSQVGWWQKLLTKVFETSKVVGGRSHRFRDTFACELLAAGVSIEDVSKLLGHKSVAVTEKHYDPWIQRRQDRLDEVTRQAWPKMPDFKQPVRVQ